MITEDQIHAGLFTLTQIIQAHGEEYWPIFDRLEAELSILQSRRSRLEAFSNPQDQKTENIGGSFQ